MHAAGFASDGADVVPREVPCEDRLPESDGADVVPPEVPCEDAHPDPVDAAVAAAPAVAAEEISDDTVLADLIPRAAAAAPPQPDAVADLAPRAAAAAPPREDRAPRQARDFVGVWKDVACPSCHEIAGQIKYDPQPGARDNATWFMRVKFEGKWGSRYPHFRRRLSQVIGESEDNPKKWILENKTGCRG